MSEDTTDRAGETQYYLPERKFRRGRLPAGPVYRPQRGDKVLEPDVEEELPEEPEPLRRKWRRGSLPEGALAPVRVNALWFRRHGADE